MTFNPDGTIASVKVGDVVVVKDECRDIVGLRRDELYFSPDMEGYIGTTITVKRPYIGRQKFESPEGWIWLFKWVQPVETISPNTIDPTTLI